MSPPMLSSPYQGLKHQDEIRVLRVLPSKQKADAPIQCVFEHHRLRDRPSYEAASYTWGPPIFQHPITIKASESDSDGAPKHIINVTYNCYNLIRSLRMSDEARRVWVDALCINQGDLDERNAQVSIMGHIYASAEETIIFLQDAGPEMRRCWGEGPSITRGSGPDDSAAEELFSNAWFNRSWIIQETLLSDNKRFIIPPFELASHEVYQLGHYPKVLEMNTDYMGNKSERPNIASQGGNITQETPGEILPIKAFDFFIDSRDFQCKEYHDKVYSILSLFSTGLWVPIDYKKSKEQVHDDFTGALFNIGDSRFLYTTHRKSWRVDWDKAPSDLLGLDVRHFAFWRSMLPSRVEREWSQLGYMAGYDGSSGSLRCLGFKIGSVQDVSKSKLVAGNSDVIKKRWQDIMQELNLSTAEIESGAYPIVHVQRRNRANLSWYRAWIRDIDEPEGGSKEYGAAGAAFCKDRPVFVCDGLVGIGTQDLQVGDEVWYLAGLNAPFCALRASPRPEVGKGGRNWGGCRYTMVGLCFFGLIDHIPAVTPREKVFPEHRIELLQIVEA